MIDARGSISRLAPRCSVESSVDSGDDYEIVAVWQDGTAYRPAMARLVLVDAAGATFVQIDALGYVVSDETGVRLR